MPEAFPIIDADTHYGENITGLHEYMPEPWRTRLRGERLSRYLPGGLGDRDVEGRIDGSRRMRDTATLSDDEVQQTIVSDMEQLGLDALLLVPNKLATIGHLSIRDLALAVCNAHIDYQLDRVADPARGIYTMPIVTWHDPEGAAELIDRVGDHPAVAAVAVLTSYSNPPWGDVRYDPVYAAAQRHRLPVVLHAASSGTLIEGATIQDGYQRQIEAHAMSFLVSNQIQLTSLITNGVPIRYPELKFVFLESGLLWIPSMIYRLDQYFLKRRSEAPLLEDLPSEYMRRCCWFGTQPIEVPREPKLLEAVFDTCDGRDHFLFASDYPHWDFDDPSAIDRLPFLTREDKAKVYAANALGVFDFAKGGMQPWHATMLERLKTFSPTAETATAR